MPVSLQLGSLLILLLCCVVAMQVGLAVIAGSVQVGVPDRYTGTQTTIASAAATTAVNTGSGGGSSIGGSLGIILGASVGGAVLLLLTIVLLVCCCCRKSHRGGMDVLNLKPDYTQHDATFTGHELKETTQQAYTNQAYRGIDGDESELEDMAVTSDRISLQRGQRKKSKDNIYV